MTSEADVERVIELGREFWARGPYIDIPSAGFVDDDLRTFLNYILTNPDAAVFLTDTAMIGGLLSPLFFNRRHVIAHELFWFSSHGSRDGQKVRRAYEEWAFDAGAAEVLMTCLADSHEKRMRNFLDKRQGYRALEVSLRKDASWQSVPEQQF